MTLEQAREWADQHRNISDHRLNAGVKAAAKVIQSLPEQWVDAEKLREFIEEWRTDCPAGDGPQILDQLESLLAPSLPTLADMSPEEREACRWMQCRSSSFGEDELLVIAVIHDEYSTLWHKSGVNVGVGNESITPLPDLPKLEWPGGAADCEIVEEQEPVDSPPAEKAALPKPEDVPAYEVWVVRTPFSYGVGYRCPEQSNPWFVIYLNMAERTWNVWGDSEITLIHKLAPEPPALPEGMRLADHETLGRIIVSPKEDSDGEHLSFFPDEFTRCGANWTYLQKSEFTYLDGETK